MKLNNKENKLQKLITSALIQVQLHISKWLIERTNEFASALSLCHVESQASLISESIDPPLVCQRDISNRSQLWRQNCWSALKVDAGSSATPCFYACVVKCHGDGLYVTFNIWIVKYNYESKKTRNSPQTIDYLGVFIWDHHFWCFGGSSNN